MTVRMTPTNRVRLQVLRLSAAGALALIAPHGVAGAAPMDRPVQSPRIVSQLPSMWHVAHVDDHLNIHHGSGAERPQVAVVDLQSSYVRIVPEPRSGWGTSVVTQPSFWSGDALYQGTRVDATWAEVGPNLSIAMTGTHTTATGSLTTFSEVRLSPPSNGAISMTLSATTNISGSVSLDNRSGEAFKQLMLSSMHVSSQQWDARLARVDETKIALPADGWLVRSPVAGRAFGLLGGTSCWKSNAPSVAVELAEPMPITGWVDGSKTDPNEDNVGMWAASDAVLASWSYRVVARHSSVAHCLWLPATLLPGE